MGEVYRALDPRLQRSVALKIIHPQLAVTPEHLERFSREAQAAGSLHHPNIVVVYDVGMEGGTPYVISEFLEGESLRDRLDRGPVPYRKALDYGIQIAHALGAAHASGIWHRDVKPANTFITTDGRVKLLDFGLAKLAEGEAAPSSRKSGPESQDSTAGASMPGAIRGTAGYMSPEQARGDRVDHRTDIFSLGAVLYEMFTGARAFQRASTVETLHAVLREEPVDPLELNPNLPPTAAVTVRRCLEKNVDERFQSARDLAFQLQQLREGTLTSRPGPATPFSSRRRALLGALVIAVAAGAVALALRARGTPPPPSFEQLSFSRGRIGGARFASEGQAIVYSEAGEGNRREVLRLDLSESPKSRSLQYPGADVLATRKGEVALSVDPRFVGGKHFVGRLVTAPIDGGGSLRQFRPDAEDADWDPSGAQLAAVFSTGTRGKSRLEYPVGKRVLYSARSIRSPRFSRDGRRIAFLEDPDGPGIGGRVAMVDMEGRYAALTDVWRSARGLAWSPSGDEVWFTAGGWWADRALRAVDLRGRQRVVLAAPSSLTLWDIARDGRVLFTRDDENRGLMGVPPGETSERDLSLYDSSGLASLSADGRQLLFADRFGLYLRSADASSPPLDLGFAEAFADDLSPDGNTVIVTTATPSRLVLVPRSAGDPRELPTYGIGAYSGALWFPDGRRILFNGAMPEKDARPYVQDIDGGPPREFAEPGTKAAAISRDGEWVAATGPEPGIWLYPVSGGPARHVPGSEREDRPVAWTADGKGLWVFRWTDVPSDVFRLEIATGRREHAKTLMPRDTAGVESILTFRTTASGDAYFYTYRRVLSKLYLARNLR